jgi:hypothetical protein
MCEFILSEKEQEDIMEIAFSSNNTLEEGIFYKYDGAPSAQRKFCQTLLRLDKLYTKDEINQMSFRNENKGFGKGNGKNPYSIFKYSGGKNCKHYWRQIEIRMDEDGLPRQYDRGIVSELMNSDVTLSPLQSIKSTIARNSLK